jgi:hypothetical protein
MFFLIRVAFWLSIVILLLPTGGSQPSGTPQVGTVEALAAAGAAVSDMRQFCARQPEACDVGSQAAAAFGQKAQASARMIYEFLTERLAGDQAAPREQKPSTPAAPASASEPRTNETTGTIAGASSRDTLTQADRATPWRGPRPRPQQEIRHSS